MKGVGCSDNPETSPEQGIASLDSLEFPELMKAINNAVKKLRSDKENYEEGFVEDVEQLIDTELFGKNGFMEGKTNAVPYLDDAKLYLGYEEFTYFK